ncbi:ribonuclease H-like domain-containing protein [Mycena rosella]|uniref:DNA polymerase delta catalytic subunit n=1 Tax=Mycena rosella TaxID=1033263 RepID=A0AAD7GIM5_MYCRO|nr:ribonuclease H-like domain-containing protein [Mycena rosella]
MLRALIAPSRGLIPTLTRLWAPVAHVLRVSPSRVQHPRSLSSGSPLSPELTRLVDPGPGEQKDVDPATGTTKDVDPGTGIPQAISAESSFADVLKDMMDSEGVPQSSESWTRPSPPPHSETEDFVFFQTEIRESVNAGQLSMFGVTKIPSMAWIKIPATKYTHISDRDKVSHCQLELAVRCPDVEVHLEPAAAPLRVLSFDVECLGREGIFPEPETDSVIQISNMVSVSGTTAPPFVRNIFTLGTCSPIAGASVLSYNEEADLLQSWSDFVRQVDPDLVIGFNNTGFDLPYLLARAKTLQVPAFSHLGRFKGIESVRARTVQYTTARGDVRTWEDIPLAGRLQLDLMHYARCEMGAKYLSLKAVSKRFLGDRKEDVHFTAIAKLQARSADTRRQLAVYCLKDAYLPQRLLEVLGCVDRYMAVAHEKRTPFNSIVADHDAAAAAPSNSSTGVFYIQAGGPSRRGVEYNPIETRPVLISSLRATVDVDGGLGGQTRRTKHRAEGAGRTSLHVQRA